jgi:hypothetical protein
MRPTRSRHAVGSHVVPPMMECAIPTGKKVARQARAAYAVS